MDALLSKIDEIITWPQRNELQGYAGQFNAIGRYGSVLDIFCTFSTILQIGCNTMVQPNLK